MPKPTFFNLPEEKRKRLLDAAEKEFSRVPLEKVSINNIITDSDISRGSFYQYFEDKEDSYFYFLSLLKKDEHENILKCFQKADGDLFAAMSFSFEMLYELYTKGKYSDFYRFIFINLTYQKSRIIYGEEQKIGKKPYKKKHIKEILELVDADKLKYDTETEVRELIEFLFSMMQYSISQAMMNRLSKEEAHYLFEQRLRWLKEGAEK